MPRNLPIRTRLSQTASFSRWHFILAGIWTFLLFLTVVFIDPEVVRSVYVPHSYWPFLALIMLTVGWWVGCGRKHIGKGLVWGVGASLYIFLRMNEIGWWWNALLIGALLLVLEYYWRIETKSDIV
jgi:hypothetical protein